MISETSELPRKQGIEQKLIVGIRRGSEAQIIPQIDVADQGEDTNIRELLSTFGNLN